MKSAGLFLLGVVLGLLIGKQDLDNPNIVTTYYKNRTYQLLDRIGADKCKEYFNLKDNPDSICDTIKPPYHF